MQHIWWKDNQLSIKRLIQQHLHFTRCRIYITLH